MCTSIRACSKVRLETSKSVTRQLCAWASGPPVQDLLFSRKYSAILMYSPGMLRQREWKAEFPLVFMAAQGRLDVVKRGNISFSPVLAGECLSFHSWACYTGGKNGKKTHFKKLPYQSESNSVVWKPGTKETQWCKWWGISAVNLAYRPIYACCGGNDITVTYPELQKIMSPSLAQALWSLFLRAIRPSIMAGTCGFSGTASWCGQNLKKESQLMQHKGHRNQLQTEAVMPRRSFLSSSYWHGGSKVVICPESESGY